MSDFEIELGTTRTIDQPDELATELTRCKTPDPREPLTYGEFSRLLSSGSLTRPPSESDPFIYRGDSELAKTDAEIRSGTPIAPEDFRRLRRGFLFKKARDKALNRIDYEKEILIFRL